jgi:trehalose-phosphatase
MKNTVPKYIFSQRDNAWHSIAKRLAKSNCLVLFLDYDGTLTPIRKAPSEAALAPKTERILQRLARLPNVHLIIVTGRSLSDIQRLIPAEKIGFVANHGFQILVHNEEWIHPDAIHAMQIFDRLYSILRNRLEVFPQAYVENKQFTLSIHYRNVTRDKVPFLKSIVRKTILYYYPKLKITQGKEVLEVRPHTHWGKGKAILEVLKTIKPSHNSLILFVGDDRTDEDAFKAIRSRGITIRVGKSTTTKAEFYVKDVQEVIRMLKTIVEIRTCS